MWRSFFRWLSGALLCLILLLAIERMLRAAEPETIYLDATQGFGIRSADAKLHGLLARELLRQAVLLAAREELGLRTRDAVLGDLPSAGGEVRFEFACSEGQKNLYELLRGEPFRSRSIWQLEAEPIPKTPGHVYRQLTEQAERLSRQEFAAALKQAGVATKARAQGNEVVSLDADIDLRLSNEFACCEQFFLVRQLHQQCETAGESTALWGGLIRGYANLGLLTEYYWHPMSMVFKARALLYAQRWAVRDPKSPEALRHRAYASALAGLHGWALDDLSEADKLTPSGVSRPAWAAVVEALCRYDFPRLAELHQVRPTAALAGLLEFIAAEQEGSRNAALKLGLATMEQLPNCQRLQDSLCELSGVGAGHVVTVVGPVAFANDLLPRIAKASDLPPSVKQILTSASSGKGLLERIFENQDTKVLSEIDARERVMRALLEVAPAGDGGEFGWPILGRMIQETSFLHAYRRIDFLKNSLAVPVDHDISVLAPLYRQHRFHGVILSLHDTRPENQPGIHVSAADVQLFQQPLWASLPEPWSLRIRGAAYRNREQLPNEAALCLRAASEDSPQFDYEKLLAASPHSPLARAFGVEREGVLSKSIPALSLGADKYPFLAATLAKAYALERKWPDTERYFKLATNLDPSLENFQGLADAYLKQGQEQQWAATLEEFLKQPDFGLYHAQVRVQLSYYYRKQRMWRKAQGFAAAAAQTHASWAMQEAALVEEALQNFEAADQWHENVLERYGENPLGWYFFCQRTGFGDLDKARRVAGRALAENGVHSPAERALFAQLEGNVPEALKQLSYQLQNGQAVAALHAAMLHDAAGNVQARNEMLAALEPKVGRRNYRSEYVILAKKLAEDLAAGGKGKLDLAKLDPLVTSLPPEEQADAYYVLGSYLNLHGQEKVAIEYWKRCLGSVVIGAVGRTLAGHELARRGIDPASWKDLLVPPKLNVNEEDFRISTGNRPAT